MSDEEGNSDYLGKLPLVLRLLPAFRVRKLKETVVIPGIRDMRSRTSEDTKMHSAQVPYVKWCLPADLSGRRCGTHECRTWNCQGSVIPATYHSLQPSQGNVPFSESHLPLLCYLRSNGCFLPLYRI